MRLYEGMFIIDSSAAATDWDAAVTGVQAILKKRGSEILQCEKWEERKFAYIVNGQRRGVYLLVYFNAPPETIVLIKKDLKLSENVMRSLIVKVDKIKEPPQAESEIDAEVDGTEEVVSKEGSSDEDDSKEGDSNGESLEEEPAPVEAEALK
ncbi:MAG: 30S ribosomal protein S6 [Planctomycetes bacterium]|nr:30S ribosomal protein S6 [Planctomycetota bacterium]